MSTRDLTNVLPVLFSELVFGSLDPAAPTFTLNRGDGGLLQSLERLSAASASRATNAGASVAAHVDHLRYGLSLLNRWAAGEADPWKDADWTLSWQKPTVSEQSWRALRDDLRREADAWLDALRTPRDLPDSELAWVVGSIAHLAYHFGAIRQIDRATRGPTAEDEQRLKK
jgi:hypothetical protein